MQRKDNYLLQAQQVIIDGTLHRRGQVLANIDADHAIKARRLDPLNQMLNSGIVEAHAVDDRATLR